MFFSHQGPSVLSWRLKVGSPFGIPLYLHFFLLAYAGLFAIFAIIQRNPLQLLWPFLLFLSVYLHELGHGFASWAQGSRPVAITLHPFGGVAETPRVRTRGGQILVLLAGPAVSLGLAVLSLVLVLLVSGPPLLRSLTTIFLLINGTLFAFNILPIYPLDGGQVLREALAAKLGEARSLRITLPISAGLLILLAVVGMATGSIGSFGFFIALLLLFENYRLWVAYRHVFSQAPSQGAPWSGLRDRMYVFLHRKTAERLMRKVDEDGIHSLSGRERGILEKYLDAKVRLRA